MDNMKSTLKITQAQQQITAIACVSTLCLNKRENSPTHRCQSSDEVHSHWKTGISSCWLARGCDVVEHDDLWHPIGVLLGTCLANMQTTTHVDVVGSKDVLYDSGCMGLVLSC